MVRPVLKDSDGSWQRVPYQVTWYGLFNSLRAAITYRAIDQFGVASADRVNKKLDNSEEDKVIQSLGVDLNGESSQIINHPYFRDTRVGGNDAINCTWQFCQDDDICYPVLATEPHSHDCGPYNGLGRVYATTTEQNAQICWFTFGVPYYTPLADFYKNSFNSDLIELNNTGETSLSIGRVFKSAFKLAVYIPSIALRFLGYLAKSMRNSYPVNRFYELRACMPLYYQYVDSILAEWLVAVGLYANGDPPSKSSESAYNHWDKDKNTKYADVWENAIGKTAGGRNSFTAGKDFIPDALKATGPSIWDILRRRALVAYGKYDEEGESTYTGESQRYEDFMNNFFQIDDDGNQVNATSKLKWNDAISTLKTDLTEDEKAAGVSKYSKFEATLYGDGTAGDTSGRQAFNPFADNGGNGGWNDAWKSSALGSSQFIGFKVNKDVDSSESFSNSTSPSQFAESYNSKVKEVAEAKSNFGMNGNNEFQSNIGWLDSVVNAGVGAIEGILEGLRDLSDGFLDMASAVVTGAYVDIPEMYSGSSFSASHSISLQLRSPYGDYISIYQSIIVPLALLMAAAMPRAAGSDSYMQPFLLRCYCKGMFSVPMGIIESISIKRGSSEFGWTYQNLPTCIDISINIKDMSPIMYMSLHNDYFAGLFVQDNAFKQYMLTLAGVGLFERISSWQRIKRNINFAMHKLRNQFFNPAYWSNEVATFLPIRMVANFVPAETMGRR